MGRNFHVTWCFFHPKKYGNWLILEQSNYRKMIYGYIQVVNCAEKDLFICLHSNIFCSIFLSIYHPSLSLSLSLYIYIYIYIYIYKKGVHRSTWLMSVFLLLQQYPAFVVHLIWIALEIGGRWPYNCYFGLCSSHLDFSMYASSASMWCIHIVELIKPLLGRNCVFCQTNQPSNIIGKYFTTANANISRLKDLWMS